jgi:hypothetical protein
MRRPIMAEINMLKGTMRKKFGKFVGSSWRGIDYVKLFGKPGNPRTAKQVAIRSVFRSVSSIAKRICAKVLKPYTFPKPRKLTEYNLMLRINRPMFLKRVFAPAELKIFEGELDNQGLTGAAQAGGVVSMTFSTATVDGDGGDDVAIGVVYDSVSGRVFSALGSRKTGSLSVSLAALPDIGGAVLHAYLVFSRPPAPETSEPGQVSNTAYAVVV